MSDENECPFEVGQWVTDGKVVGHVVYMQEWGYRVRYIRPGVDMGHAFADPSRWVAFEPADIATSSTEGRSPVRHILPWLLRVNEAEARVAELEEELVFAKAHARRADDWSRRAHVAEMRLEELEAKRSSERASGLPPLPDWAPKRPTKPEMEPPPGHVLVPLPREIVEDCAKGMGYPGITIAVRRGCERALEADDD